MQKQKEKRMKRLKRKNINYSDSSDNEYINNDYNEEYDEENDTDNDDDDDETFKKEQYQKKEKRN